MAAPFPPSAIRVWQYSTTKGGIEKNLKINPAVPLGKPSPNQHLVQIIAAALNPVDYKPAELPIFGRLLISRPATPCVDIAGCIVTPATDSTFKPGQLVFGSCSASPFTGGALSEFRLVDNGLVVPIPSGVDPVDAATVAVAGLTAYQSLAPRVKEGDKVFINGGSGGTGIFGIQIAKVMGCHVTTTCSTANVELCKQLGADEVVDYKKGSVVEALKASGQKFDLIIDNVGADNELYWHSHEYSQPQAVYLMIAGSPSLRGLGDMLKRKFWPGFLGGGKRKMEGFFAKLSYEELEIIGKWMQEGKVKAVIDQKLPFEQAPQAFERLKTGRARGKVVVDVASETYKKDW